MALGDFYDQKFSREPVVEGDEIAELHGPIPLLQTWTITSLLDRILAHAT